MISARWYDRIDAVLWHLSSLEVQEVIRAEADKIKLPNVQQ